MRVCVSVFVSVSVYLCACDERSKGRYTLDIFARDIKIKRYCDKKIILSHQLLLAKVSS